MLAYGETHKDKNALAATRTQHVTAESRRENTSTKTGPQTVLVHEWPLPRRYRQATSGPVILIDSRAAVNSTPLTRRVIQ